MPVEYAASYLVGQIAAEEPPSGAVALWGLGQASFVLRGAGIVVYVDPYLRVSDRRLSPPPFSPEAVANADVVLLTHDHGDHVDPETLPGLAAASPAARFVAPRPIANRVADLVGGKDRVVPAVADEPLRLEVRTVPLGHFVSYASEVYPNMSIHVMGRFGKYVHLGRRGSSTPRGSVQ